MMLPLLILLTYIYIPDSKSIDRNTVVIFSVSIDRSITVISIQSVGHNQLKAWYLCVFV